MKRKFLLFIFNATLFVNMLIIKLPCTVKNCLKCDSDTHCQECEENYTLNENKCYSNFSFILDESGLNKFISELKNSANGGEISVLEYVKKKIISHPEISKKEIKTDNFINEFMSLREKLNFLQLNNERACRKKINEFIVSFEENMQVITSLANFYEQKTVFEIEKQRNSILEILNSDNLEPSTKLDVVNRKLDDLRQIILSTFEDILEKIKKYENISTKKITRAKKSFYLNIKKFLN